MTKKVIDIDSETSRIRAAFVNAGGCTFAEAEDILARSRVAVVLGADAARTLAGQAAFLTAVVTGARCFGKLNVYGALEEDLLLPLPLGVTSLRKAAEVLGAVPADPLVQGFRVVIGLSPETCDTWSVHAFWDGWTAGTTPANRSVAPGRSDCVLAGVAAGGLAIGQAFMALQGDVRAGRSVQRLSLWHPGVDTTDACAQPIALPLAYWLVGLGNLGQAYLWSLTLLPYPRSEDVLVFCQDDERIGKENWGTSVLVKHGGYGMLKTRVAEDWALARGFQVRRIDRRLDEHLLRSPFEPGLALAGLDGMAARRLLGQPGFAYVIDAGLGRTAAEYRHFRVNIFDASSNPAEHFRDVEDQTAQVTRALLELPAYQEIARTHDDGGCGVAMLAERSVAVPYVSAVVGALALAQAIRIASGREPVRTVTGDVGDLRTVQTAYGSQSSRLVIPVVQSGF
jgi:hypothetical protein